ncbi:MAG: type IV secretory system conjugative DNA transfer family protein, partial [Patescibacteria group bacterium]
KLKLLSISLPQKLGQEGEKKDVISEINASSQLFSLLTNLKAPFTLEIAVHNIGEDINFYLAVPEESIQFVSRQIQGIWPSAQVKRSDDYTIFNSSGVVKAAYLKQKQHYGLPIRTYAEAGLDTFAPILSNFSKLEAVGEGLAMQVIAKPAPSSAKQNISKMIYNLKKGISLPDILKGKTSVKKPEKDQPQPPLVIDEDSVKMLTEKVAKPLFNVNIRLVSSAVSTYRAEELLHNLLGSFNQFSSPLRNEFKTALVPNPKNLISKFIFREYDSSQSMTLGADEIASIVHLPTTTTAEIPKVQWVKSKEAPPPSNLPEIGVTIGETAFRGEVKPVRVGDEDRRRHLYIIGQTGTGKSTLLVNMICADVEAGKGIAVLDPHGELIENILGVIPENRLNDVIVFDPGDISRPLGLNMLEYNPTRVEEKTFIVNEMQSIFNKLFTAETMGPMFEQYMRNALLLLMDDPNEKATLMEVSRVFTDVEYRKRLLAKAVNPAVVDFWEKEAVKVGGEASLSNMTPYITSKFNNFTANDYVRPIIGQPTSSFNFRKIMDEGKILLVNLSKGKIGDINAGLLGMVIVGKILMAALSRVDLPQEQRRDFNLYIDEFQNFTTDSIATILSEARKYRLSMVIAHQFIAQLTEKIRDAVFGNVGSMVMFRIGADDAEFLVKQVEPVFGKNDLLNIDNFNAFAKLLINGQTSKPFNIRTIKPKPGNMVLAGKLKELSQLTYGRDRQSVEAEILKRLRT